MAFHKIADMTDQQWIDLVDELSAQGRYYFTLNQLFIHWQKPKVYRLYKSLTRLYISVFMLALFLFNQSLAVLIGMLSLGVLTFLPKVGDYLAYPMRNPRFKSSLNLLSLISLIGIYYYAQWHMYIVLPLLLGGFAMVESIFLRNRLGKKRFMLHLALWKRIYRMKNLLIKPRLQKPIPHLQQEALYDYQVRTLLIVDQDLTVDFFVKNGFHQQMSTLIFSIQKYPHYMSQLAFRLLANHQDIQVFILHKDGQKIEELRTQLKKIGVKSHRISVLGLHKNSKYSLIRHLGFNPLDWSEWHVDTLPPHSLFEGVLCAIQSQISLRKCLHPNLQVYIK